MGYYERHYTSKSMTVLVYHYDSKRANKLESPSALSLFFFFLYCILGQIYGGCYNGRTMHHLALAQHIQGEVPVDNKYRYLIYSSLKERRIL